MDGTCWPGFKLWLDGSSSTLFGKVNFSDQNKSLSIINSQILDPLIFRQIGVGHQSVSLLWTARAVGDTSGYVLAGTTFGSSWMDSSKRRLLFLGIFNVIVAICLFAIPFINKFMLMILRKLITMCLNRAIGPTQ